MWEKHFVGRHEGHPERSHQFKLNDATECDKCSYFPSFPGTKLMQAMLNPHVPRDLTQTCLRRYCTFTSTIIYYSTQVFDLCVVSGRRLAHGGCSALFILITTSRVGSFTQAHKITLLSFCRGR